MPSIILISFVLCSLIKKKKKIVQCDQYVKLCFNCSGKWLGSRQIRCNWATKGAVSNEDKQSSDAKSVVELTNGSSGE